jgi:hypothetical protein
MKSIVAAIARALASLAQFVVEKVWIAGAWVWSLVRKPTPAPASIPDGDLSPPMSEAALQAKAAGDAALAYDVEMADIRIVAAHIRKGIIPSPEISGRISERHYDWLLACTDSMLDTIVKSKQQELRDHVMGRKSLRGVLITDPATVREFVRGKEPVHALEDGSFEPATPRFA